MLKKKEEESHNNYWFRAVNKQKKKKSRFMSTNQTMPTHSGNLFSFLSSFRLNGTKENSRVNLIYRYLTIHAGHYIAAEVKVHVDK